MLSLIIIPESFQSDTFHTILRLLKMSLNSARLLNVAAKRINLGAMSQFSSQSSGLGDLGSGAGQGGGDGGSIRSAGGSFGKREAAMEGEYFYKLQQKQLEDLKGHLGEELKFHQEQLKAHQDAINRINEKLKGDQK